MNKMKLSLKKVTLLLAVSLLFNSPFSYSDDHGIPMKYEWFQRGNINSAQPISDGIYYKEKEKALAVVIETVTTNYFIPENYEWGYDLFNTGFEDELLTVQFRWNHDDGVITTPAVGITIRPTCDHLEEGVDRVGIFCGCVDPDKIPVEGKCMPPTECTVKANSGHKGYGNIIGNPCDVATGAKYHNETLSFGNGLSYQLSYNSGQFQEGSVI